MRTFRFLAIVGVCAAIVGCGGDTNQKLLVTDPLESDFLADPFQGPIGDYEKEGNNIGTMYAPGQGTGMSSLRFFRIEKTSSGVTRHNVANLAQRTVEIQVLDGDLLRLETHTGQVHYDDAEEFYIESQTDFKISLNFPPDTLQYYIVGEEDGRPAVHEMFTATKISFDGTNPRKVRISYTPNPTDQKRGVIKISGQNTTVGVNKTSCLPNKSGVPHQGWGSAYGKPCPYDN